MPETRKKKAADFFQYFFFVFYLSSLAAGIFYMRPLAAARLNAEREGELHAHIRRVLPDFLNKPWNESFVVDNVRIYPGRKEEKVTIDTANAENLPETKEVTAIVLSGFAFKVPAAEGPEIWLGFDLQGNAAAADVETAPGQEMGKAEKRGLAKKILRHLNKPEDQPAEPGDRKIFESADAAVKFFADHKPDIFMKANEAGQS